MPIRVHQRKDGLKLDWGYLGDTRFTEPCFDHSITKILAHPAHLLFRHETPMSALAELAGISPGLPPAGFIFHGSRCGSTLVSQMLAALPENVVIAEAGPIDTVLRAHLRAPSITEEERVLWLRGLLNAFGQRRHAAEKRLFVKFDSWHAFFLPFIQRVFPDVPWIFVYRAPVEVLMSQNRQMGAHMVPSVLEPCLFGSDAEAVSRMNLGEYGGRVLSGIYKAALVEAQAGRGRLVNYKELPGVVWPSLLRYWGVECQGQAPEIVARVSRLNAKNPSMLFRDDTEAKNQGAPEGMRQFARLWFGEVFQQLEEQRLKQNALTPVQN
jgi:hypothetical protein